MQPSENAENIIKEFELCDLHVYSDVADNATIGWGHKLTDDEDFIEINQSKADELLKQDIQIAAICVNNKVKVTLNQNQFDALIDFVYNLGCKSFQYSTLLRLLNQNHFIEASQEFGKWIFANGKIRQDLVIRRQKEKELFLTPC